MFSFTTEQETYRLGKKNVGGLPGENPTLMVGSIFYEGQYKEPKENKEKTVRLIDEQEGLADKLGITAMVDLFIYEEEEIQWKIDFALDNIDGLFSLDMPDAEVRMETLEYLDEKGALDRAVYNSMNLGMTDEEKEMLEEHTPEAAVLLGYNPQDNSVQGRLDMIKNGGQLLEKGMLDVADEIGLKYPLLDTASTPFGEHSCETIRAVPVFKSEFGLPTGCAMHNTVEAWEWLKKQDEGRELTDLLDASIDNLPVLLGADFVYYGPIENSKIEMYNIGMVNKLIAEGAEEYFGTQISEEHPFYRME